MVQLAVGAGIGVPGMTSSLSYFDTYRRGRLPANLVQVVLAACVVSCSALLLFRSWPWMPRTVADCLGQECRMGGLRGR